MSKTITITREDIFHEAQLSLNIPDIIDKIIERQVIGFAAEELGIKVTKEELQEASDQMRVMSQLKDAQATWMWLEKYCLSLDDFEELVYHSLISQKLSNHLFADKVESYFYENQLDYAGAIIYEMVLEDEDEAIELFYEIKENEITFQEAAQEYIQDLELRRQGGYRGEVKREDLKPEVSAAVFASASPTILKPITSADGVHLVMVVEIIKPELDRELRQQLMSDLFLDWLRQRANQVQVVSNLGVSERVA